MVDLAELHCRLYYIKAKRCAKMEEMIGSFGKESWEKIRLDTQEMELADIPGYCPFGRDKLYRPVVTRIRRKDSHMDMFSGETYTYRWAS